MTSQDNDLVQNVIPHSMLHEDNVEFPEPPSFEVVQQVVFSLYGHSAPNLDDCGGYFYQVFVRLIYIERLYKTLVLHI